MGEVTASALISPYFIFSFSFSFFVAASGARNDFRRLMRSASWGVSLMRIRFLFRSSRCGEKGGRAGSR